MTGQSTDARESPTFTAESIPPSKLFTSGLFRLTRSALFLFKAALFLFLLHTADLVLFLLNLVTPPKKRLRVVPRAFSPFRPPLFGEMPVVHLLCRLAGTLGEKYSPAWLWTWTHWRGVGHRGNWMPSAPEKGWSRSPCPALNALANSGVISRDGCHLTPVEISAAIQYSYNLAPTIAIQLMLPFEPLWRDRGWLDLSDIGAQGLVQHDGSFAREDTLSPHALGTPVATQATPSRRLLDLYFPKNVDVELTWQNHSKIQAHARMTARNHNPQFIFNPVMHVFSAGNSALMHSVVGGKISDLRSWLGADKGYEEVVDGFESKVTQGWGITILQAQLLTLLIELGAGAVDGTPRFTRYRNGVEAMGGWNPALYDEKPTVREGERGGGRGKGRA